MKISTHDNGCAKPKGENERKFLPVLTHLILHFQNQVQYEGCLSHNSWALEDERILVVW